VNVAQATTDTQARTVASMRFTTQGWGLFARSITARPLAHPRDRELVDTLKLSVRNTPRVIVD
jgi:hypothetical protein